MAALIGDEGDNIREYPQVVDRYLSVAPQLNLFSARVNGPVSIANSNDNSLFGVWLDEVSTSIFVLHYDSESGVAADCDEGFTVLIGTTPGARDIGVMYLRAAIDTGQKLIYVSETAYGEVPVHDNDYITVIYEQHPQQSVLRLQTTAVGSQQIETDFIEYHNYDETYINQNNYILPVANINKPSDYPERRLNATAAGWCKAEWDGNLRITLTSEFSYSLNGNPVSTLWDIADCTLVSGTLTDEEITIDCPAGWRYIKLVVTDTETEVSSRPRYHPVFAHNDEFPTIDFGTRGFRVSADSRGDGRRMSFDVFGQDGDASELVFPRGALVVYWEEPYFNATEVPELYISQFIGWISSKQFRPVKHAGTLTVEVFGIEGWMAEHLSGFGTRITDTSHLPVKWYEMEDITVGKMIHYLLREYSTVLYSANLYLPTLTRHDKAEDVNKDKLWNQIKTIAGAFACVVGADSGNAIWVREDPYYALDRGTITSMGTIGADDITEEGITVTESEVKTIGVVNGTGSVWDGTSDESDIFASRSPGVSPGTGDGSDQYFWRVDGQDHLNWLTGQLYAKLNSKFKNLQFTLIGNMDVYEPCWHEIILIDYDEPNLSDYEIGANTSFLITQINVAHSEEQGSPSKRLTIIVQELTTGVPGVFILIPDDPLPSPVVIDPNDWVTQPSIPPVPDPVDTDPVAEVTPDPTPANPTPAPLPLGFAVTGLNKKLCRTFHFIDSDVLWTDVTPPLERGDLIDYKAIWNESGSTMHCYAAFRSSETTIKIWKCDIFQQNVSWTLDATLTIEGTNPTAIGSIDFNDTTSTAAIAYLAEDGVYAAVKSGGTWGTFVSVSGDDSFTDDTIADRDLQLVVDADDNIIVCGLTDDKTYQLFIAPGNDSFTAMDDTPLFNTPVNSIALSGTDMYVSSWNADGSGGTNGEGADGNEGTEHTTSASTESCSGAGDNFTDEMTSGLGPGTFEFDGTYNFGVWNGATPDETGSIGGTWTPGVGRTGGGCVQGGDVPGSPNTVNQAGVVLDLGAEFTVSAASMWTNNLIAPDAGNSYITFRDSSKAILSTQTFFTGSGTSWVQSSWTGSMPGVRYVVFQTNCSGPGVCVVDDIVVEIGNNTVETYDFTSSDNGWVIQSAFSQDLGSYTPGVGFEDAENITGGNTYRIISISKTFDEPITLRSFRATFAYSAGTIDPTGDTSYGVTLDGVPVDTLLFPATPTSPRTATGEFTGTVLNIGIECGVKIDGSDPGGSITLTEIEIEYESSRCGIEYTVNSGTQMGETITSPEQELVSALVDPDAIVYSRRVKITFAEPVKSVSFDYNYGGGATGDGLFAQLGSEGVVSLAQSGSAFLESEVGANVLIVDLGYTSTPGIYDDSPMYIENINGCTDCSGSNGITDPEGQYSSSGFPAFYASPAAYPLLWDVTDDDPKQFTADGGFLGVRWNFLEDQNKELTALHWYLNIEYSSNLSTAPDSSTKLKFRWKVTMKEKDKPPDFTQGELTFTKAASLLEGSAGNYTRTVTSPDMLVGLDIAGKELEYLECRADLVPPAVNLADGALDDIAQWRIYTSPFGDTGSPSISYKTGNDGGSGSLMYRIEDYATAPDWTKINPDSTSEIETKGRAAKKKYGLAIDATTPTTIYMCGFDEVNSWICMSEDSGDSWSLVAKFDGNWLKVNDSTFLIGGEGSLTLALNGIDGDAASRKGDLQRFQSPPVPGHTEVLISG